MVVVKWIFKHVITITLRASETHPKAIKQHWCETLKDAGHSPAIKCLWHEAVQSLLVSETGNFTSQT